MEPQEYHTLFSVEDTHWWFKSLHEHVVRCLQCHAEPFGKAQDKLRRSMTSGNVSPFASAQGDTPALRFFDAGCGTGGLAKHLSALGEVEGVDSSPLAIEYCRKRGLTGMQYADLNTFTLERERYDAITSIDVLYHRSILDPLSIMKKFHAALKPGGIFFLHLPAFEFLRSSHDTLVHTGHRYTLREAKKLVRDAGLEVEHASYRLMFLFLPVLFLRWLRTPFQKKETSDIGKVSPLINIPLLFLSRMENALSRVIPLPFGVSLYVIARKTSP